MNMKSILALALALFIPAAVHAQNQEIVVQQPPPLPGKYAGGTPVSCPQPAWPREALRYELEGTTTTEVLVGDDGKPYGQRVYKSSGWDILDEATLSMMASCRFIPITRDGQPVGAHWSKVAFKWTLEQEGNPSVSRPVLIRESCAGAEGLVLVDNPASGRGVLLRFLVSPEGKPFGIKVVKDGTSTELQEAAVRKLESCKFLPSVNRGAPVPGNAFARYQADLSR
ncbi:TonB family protein [Duganella sp. CY15W]|uniref:TonB family protein n=1 Tax=Duganella sp. CY15W TaxID=2692172 RepID=UPI0013705609|nr:TonB family protein [Duganella sp. CY15W]MYM27409.1 TonB family protein [Duganella sp. CY15W]